MASPFLFLVAACASLDGADVNSAKDDPVLTINHDVKQAVTPTPPVAAQKPHRASAHGKSWDDPWAWLRDPGYPQVDDPEILAYLNAENAYFTASMKPYDGLVEELFQEMKGRIKEDEKSVPQKDGAWVYWTEFEKGGQYKKWYRRAAGPDGKGVGEAVLLLDEPALAKDKDYFRLSEFSVSPDGKLLAYAVDDDGSERFEVRFKNLETGALLPDTIPGTLSSIEWSADSAMVLYGLANENWRTDNIHVHKLGTPVSEDKQIFKEADIGFSCDVGVTASEKYLVIATGDNETSEVRLIPRDNPFAKPILVSPRKKGREYSVEEHDDTLYIYANDTHPNFRIATASLAKPDQWTTLIAGSDNFYITDFSAFRDYYVVEGREGGLDQIELRSYADPAKVTRIPFPEASYSAGLDSNPEYGTHTLRLAYESMVTPDTVYDYDVDTGALTTLKVQEIPSGYNPADYVTERVEIKGRDGTMIPVSLVYKKGLAKNGTAPLHLYAYGAYGYAVPPSFSTTRLSLVDYGYIYGIAHIRGGDDLGRNWYLQGKLDKRQNTFNDFVDVAQGLVDKDYTRRGKISASGGSAGGELMGAIVNMDPSLWGAVVAHVPFVDVINTMMDESLPLTPGEWPEWGNPITDKAAFETMWRYSPYDNVTAKAYPPMLVTAGLNDPRVTYWEPAKWVAKLRATKTDQNLLLLKTNMGAGHGGKSGRFESLREDAEEQAFILSQMGMVK